MLRSVTAVSSKRALLSLKDLKKVTGMKKHPGVCVSAQTVLHSCSRIRSKEKTIQAPIADMEPREISAFAFLPADEP